MRLGTRVCDATGHGSACTSRLLARAIGVGLEKPREGSQRGCRLRGSFAILVALLVSLLGITLLAQPAAADGEIVVGPAEPLFTSPGGNYIYGLNLAATDISGETLLYEQTYGSHMDLYALDLTSGASTLVASGTGIAFPAALSGQTVVWVDYSAGESQGDIYAYDLATSTTTAVCTSAGNQTFPDIDGDLVVWQDNRNGDWDVYGYDLSEGRELAISVGVGDQYRPKVSGDLVVWTDWQSSRSRIKGYDLATDTDFQFTMDPAQGEAPSVSGDTVIWVSDQSIWGYNRATEDRFQICNRTYASSFSGQAPSISGRLVVWQDKRNYATSGFDIYGYDLVTGTSFPICTAPLGQFWPRVSGGTLIWHDSSRGLWDIYGATVDFSGVDDTTAPATAHTYDGLWYNADVTLHFSATDNEGGSGVASTEYSLDGETWTEGSEVTIAAEGLTTVSYRSSDNAGNVEETKTVEVKIDRTAPAISVMRPTEGAQYLLGQEVRASYSATDDLSGVENLTGSVPDGLLDTASFGSKQFTVSATDAAGNSSTVTVTYSVVAASNGLSEPVNIDGSSIFKLGSTVPFKFSLADENGAPLTGLAPMLHLSKLSDGIWGDESEPVSTNKPDAGNTFRETAPGTYMFNLSTKNFESGTYRVRIELGNGGELLGQFSVE